MQLKIIIFMYLMMLNIFSGCTIVNGAPAPACFDECQKNILRLADIFCVNESEAEIYTNNVIKIDGIETAKHVLTLLLRKGGKIVIITLGPLGAVFASVDKPEPQWVVVPKIEDPIDTTVSIYFITIYDFSLPYHCRIQTCHVYYVTGCWGCIFRSSCLFHCS